MDAEGNPVQVTQLTFLRLLSAIAHQNFTLLCQNAAAWYEARTGSHERALRFLTFNGVELMHNTTEAPVRILHDGCQVRSWPSSLFPPGLSPNLPDISTEQASHLSDKQMGTAAKKLQCIYTSQ
uniref:Fibrillar collagen NC1 domain-containing protein n=1 Tax=Varanus komodoensis TaxID=61221 RepID=A0A8D2INB3_VARKO